MEGLSSRSERSQRLGLNNIKVEADTESKKVGITESYNEPGQGGLDIPEYRVIAEELSSQLKKTLVERSSKEGLNSSKNEPSAFSNNTVEAGADTKNVTITRTTFSNNKVEAGADAKNVGMSESFNRPDLGGLDVSGNTVIAGERAQKVGVYNVGNTRPIADE